jgi:two-component system, NarL family, response regulator NreC
MGIRILLADDHGMMREGLKSLIAKQIGMEVIGEASDGHTAVRMTHDLDPDVVVMDIGMPDLNGIEATRQITSESRDVKVLGLSQYSDPRMVTEMFRAGAKGFLLKDSAFDELVRAVNAVYSERTYVSPDIAGDLIRKHVRQIAHQDEETAFSLLSDREREVLQLLAEGKTTKEIAVKLYRSAKTVETHRRNIMQKLDIHTLPELTKYAVRQGLTGLDK